MANSHTHIYRQHPSLKTHLVCNICGFAIPKILAKAAIAAGAGCDFDENCICDCPDNDDNDPHDEPQAGGEVCRACERGEHRYCGMQVWCECEDADDGDATREEWEAYQKRVDKDED